MARPLNVGNMGGIGDFVAALTGRDAIRQQAQKDAWGQADDVARARKNAAQARQEEDTMRAIEQLGPALEALGVDPNLGTVMRGGFGNFDSATQGLGNVFDLRQTQQAADLAAKPSPDVEMFNRILAARVRGGGPLTANQAVAGALGAELVGTEDARQAELMARAEANRARAGYSDARTAYQQARTPIRFTDADGMPATVTDPWNMPPDAVQEIVSGKGTAPSLGDVVAPAPAPAPARRRANAPAALPRRVQDASSVTDTTNPRVKKVNGRSVVIVNAPEEARAAWEKLEPGMGIMTPDGQIDWK